MPLLTGTDGKEKMSKSYGNQIGVADPPEEMYGKTLSVPDPSLPDWYGLLLGGAPDPGLGPRDAKRALARALVRRFHDATAAQAAEERFDRVHVRHEPPSDLPDVSFAATGDAIHLPALLAAAFGVSTSEGRRGVGQGAVRIDGDPVATLDLPVATVDGRVLQLGKRRFARVRIVAG